jgi:phage I-like protein
MPIQPPLKRSLAALALPPVVGGAQVLIPAGDFDAPRGALSGAGPWHLGPEQGQRLAAALQGRATDIPIDYEHQILRAKDNGQPAPAAGWIVPARIAFDPALGLVAAAVAWTERAAAMIAAGEYRYLSPVFPYAAGGEVTGLLSLALTNTPALDVLPEVALAAASCPYLAALETPMPVAPPLALHPLLGLPDTATHDELQAALEKLTGLLGAARMADGTAAASVLLYMEEAPTRIAALSAQPPAPATDQAAVIAELQGQIAALTAADQAKRKQEVLTAALSDGRLMAGSALFTHASGLDLPQLEALTRSLTPIAALSGTQTGGTPPPVAAPAADDEGGPFTAALAAEFGDEPTYRAFVRADRSGRVRIYGAAQ